MRNCLIGLSFFALVGATGSPAAAAEISIVCSPGCYYAFNGDIVPGDYERFRSLLKQRHTDIDWVVLDSRGGDVQEALRIAGLLRDAFLATRPNVHHDKSAPSRYLQGICASACFLIWVGGVDRAGDPWLDGDTKLSPFYLHRPYFDSAAYASNNAKTIAEQTSRLNSVVREYLVTNGVPQNLIDQMFKRSSVDAYRLTRKETYSVDGPSAWYEEWRLARCGVSPLASFDDMTREKQDEAMVSPATARWYECERVAKLEARKRFMDSLK